MQKRISKKILLYLFILLILGTPNNREFLELRFNKNYNFEIFSLSEFNDSEIVNELLNYRHQNLFFLEREKIIGIMKKYKIIDDFYFYKKYPSKLIVNFKKTQFLAITQIDGLNFYIGSNGNLISTNNDNLYNLPVIFGKVEVEEFIKFKSLIDNSIFDFKEIKNLYYFKSKRWDIETKDGLLIKLPKENLVKSFELFINILNNKDLQNMNIIDLRQNNQIILDG